MNDMMRIGALAALLAIGGTAVWADSHRGSGGPRGGMPEFSSFDADGDGQVTLEELTAHREARFAALDGNGDGQVTLEEFQAEAMARASERAAQMFERLDADGDGQLGRDALEAQNRGPSPERVIARLDKNDDGAISEAEFEAAKSRMQARDGGKRKNR